MHVYVDNTYIESSINVTNSTNKADKITIKPFAASSDCITTRSSGANCEPIAKSVIFDAVEFLHEAQALGVADVQEEFPTEADGSFLTVPLVFDRLLVRPLLGGNPETPE